MSLPDARAWSDIARQGFRIPPMHAEFSACLISFLEGSSLGFMGTALCTINGSVGRGGTQPAEASMRRRFPEQEIARAASSFISAGYAAEAFVAKAPEASFLPRMGMWGARTRLRFPYQSL